MRSEITGKRCRVRVVTGDPVSVSCCPLVLVDQSAKDPPPPCSRRRKVGDPGHRDVVTVRWSQVSGSVRAMPVVVGGVLVQDRAQVPWPGDEHPVGHLGPDSAYPPLGVDVRPRAARRDLHHLHPAPASTASNIAVNRPARSRIRNLKRPARSPRSSSRFRACCTVHDPSGCEITPRTWTWRVPTSITKNT
jgi:hypothetical protein